MSRSYSRPIVVTATGTGIQYIPINRYAQDITIQVTAGGSTFTVDYTLDNIVRDQANSYDVHGGPLVEPASAEWTEITLTAGAFRGSVQAMALRLNVTAYVGDVIVRIAQSA